MGWKEPSAAEQQLAELLMARGIEVSWAKIRRWREFGALPWGKRYGLGRGSGSASALAADTAAVAEALAVATVTKRRLEEAVLHVFTVHPQCSEVFVATCVPLPERAVRKALAWSIGQDRSNVLACIERAVEAAGGDADRRMDAALEAAHGFYRRWQRRAQLTRRKAGGTVRAGVPHSRADAHGLATFAVAVVLGYEELRADGVMEALSNSFESADDESFSAEVFAEMRSIARKAECLGEEPFSGWPAWTSMTEAKRRIDAVDFSTICTVRDVLAFLVASAPVLRLASLAGLQDPAVRHIAEVRASNPRTDYYLTCADAISRRIPTQAWQSFIPLLIQICTTPRTLETFQQDVTALDPALDDISSLGQRAAASVAPLAHPASPAHP